MYKVLKFGGTSVASTTKLNEIADYLKTRVENNEKLVIVVSAMNKLTDELIKLANEVNSNPCGRELDRLLSTGEQQTISLLTLSCLERELKAISLTAVQLNILTDTTFNNAKISSLKNDELIKYLDTNDIVIVAGFQGVNLNNEVTTLGRGGSDTTAVALASVLNTTCEIYTDVEGIYATDPRIVSNVKKIDYITFDEMSELSSLGAGVMHNRSINLAKKYNTDIYVAKSMSNRKGTYIMNEINETNIVTAITKDDNIINFTISSNDKNLITTILDQDINVDMVSQVNFNNQNITAFSTTTDNLQTVISTVGTDNIIINDNLSKISLVGLGMRDASGVMARIYNTLKNNEIDIIQTSTSEITVSLLISKEHANNAIKCLCNEFELEA